ncbi:sodium:solute symporter family transporter [Portibacter marinus]|uniref:sodium:solute symporter family transporter n=1 Tax=Portibacter marinus TaxID=2898660 RepID=UPI001EE9FF1D|nr:sodium/solute symporter [Portibacter marinus]
MDRGIEIGYGDIFILLLFFLFVGVIGYLVSIRKPTTDQLFFAGRNLNWPIIGFSIIASNISTLTIIGLTADAYVYGVSASSYEWMASLILIVLAIFVVPIYIKNKINTVPEYFGKRYGPIVRKYFSVISLIISSAVNIAGPLYAGALLINLFIPQISVWEASVAIALFAATYTSFGGLNAVVYTDFFQSILFLMISVIVCFALFSQYNFDISQVTAVVSVERFDMLNNLDHPFLPWLGLITGVPILGFYFWCTDQVIIQRVLAARSILQAQRGIFFGAALKLSILFVIVIPGILAVGLFPDIEQPQDLYALFITQLIPTGVLGLVLSGLLAAMMSSVDSALNSSATLITYDFVQKKYPQFSDQKLVLIGRVSVAFMMLVSLSWTPLIQYANGIWAYAQTFLAYLVPPLVCLMFFGIFSKKGNQHTALITLILGHLGSLFIFICQYLGWLELHFTISAALIFVISIAVFFISSWKESHIDTEQSLQLYFNYQNYYVTKQNKIIAIGIIIATLLTILPFFF